MAMDHATATVVAPLLGLLLLAGILQADDQLGGGCPNAFAGTTMCATGAVERRIAHVQKQLLKQLGLARPPALEDFDDFGGGGDGSNATTTGGTAHLDPKVLALIDERIQDEERELQHLHYDTVYVYGTPNGTFYSDAGNAAAKRRVGGGSSGPLIAVQQRLRRATLHVHVGAHHKSTSLVVRSGNNILGERSLVATHTSHFVQVALSTAELTDWYTSSAAKGGGIMQLVLEAVPAITARIAQNSMFLELDVETSRRPTPENNGQSLTASRGRRSPGRTAGRGRRGQDDGGGLTIMPHGSPKRSCANSETKCCAHRLEIDFHQLGWTWIVHPRRINARLCYGDCPRHTLSRSSSAHAMMLSSFVGARAQPLSMALGGGRTITPPTTPPEIGGVVAPQPMYPHPASCCHPTGYEELTVVYRIDRGEVRVSRLSNVIASDCGCS